MSGPVIIVGAGGHGRVLADALLLSGRTVLGFVDADPALCGASRLGLPVLGSDADLQEGRWPEAVLVNGVGGRPGARVRREVQERLEAGGRRFTGVIHPAAVVSAFADVDETAQVLARAVVQAGATVSHGSIVNTAAVVEHDGLLEPFVHLAPGAVLCGDVRIGAGSHIGAGAVVREGVRLGPGVVVGAGAVVLADHPGPGVLVGNPARERMRR
ncbi:sugar acetyltransferase [Rhizobium sp. CRIBSB]|nr:sugar acetyltransferase [Rhizobium sp. CRIBSB]